MERKAKSGNGESEQEPGAGHNSGTEQDKIKFFHRFTQWVAAKEQLEQFEEAAKAELGEKAIRDFRTALKLQAGKGVAAIKERIERELEIARWVGLAVGTQTELFPAADRTPIGDKAYAAGELAALTAGRRDPPHAPGTEAYDRWLTGYADQSERILRSGIREMQMAPADEHEHDVRPRFLQQPEA